MYEKIPTIISINMNCEYFVYKTCQKSEFIIKSSMPSEIIRLKFFERVPRGIFFYIFKNTGNFYIPYRWYSFSQTAAGFECAVSQSNEAFLRFAAYGGVNSNDCRSVINGFNNFSVKFDVFSMYRIFHSSKHIGDAFFDKPASGLRPKGIACDQRRADT